MPAPGEDTVVDIIEERNQDDEAQPLAIPIAMRGQCNAGAERDASPDHRPRDGATDCRGRMHAFATLTRGKDQQEVRGLELGRPGPAFDPVGGVTWLG